MAEANQKRFQGHWNTGDGIAVSWAGISSWDTLEDLMEYIQKHELHLAPEDVYLEYVLDKKTGTEYTVVEGALEAS
jgi:hypothetical protein